MTLNDDSISQLSNFLDVQNMKLLDAIKLEVRDNQKWIDSIIYQSVRDSKIKKKRCEICNSKEEPKDLEKHHIAGEKHDFRTATACIPICHRWLSDKQKTWDKRWLEVNQPDNLRQSFFLLGLQDMLILKSKNTGNSIYEKLGYSYNEKINVLLEWWQN
jgi:hypothetical protein